MPKGININLLSFQAQEDIRYEFLRRLLIRVGIVAVLLLGVLIVFLVISILYVSILRSGIVGDIEATQRLSSAAAREETERKVQAARQLIQSASVIVDSQFVWTQALEGIITALPPDISLTSISGNTTLKTITVAGVAPTRAAVLAAETALRALPFITRVDSPRSNVTPQRDIAFTFTLIVPMGETKDSQKESSTKGSPLPSSSGEE